MSFLREKVSQEGSEQGTTCGSLPGGSGLVNFACFVPTSMVQGTDLSAQVGSA
jgi:hypothetical protein